MAIHDMWYRYDLIWHILCFMDRCSSCCINGEVVIFTWLSQASFPIKVRSTPFWSLLTLVQFDMYGIPKKASTWFTELLPKKRSVPLKTASDGARKKRRSCPNCRWKGWKSILGATMLAPKKNLVSLPKKKKKKIILQRHWFCTHLKKSIWNFQHRKFGWDDLPFRFGMLFTDSSRSFSGDKFQGVVSSIMEVEEWQSRNQKHYASKSKSTFCMCETEHYWPENGGLMKVVYIFCLDIFFCSNSHLCFLYINMFCIESWSQNGKCFWKGCLMIPHLCSHLWAYEPTNELGGFHGRKDGSYHSGSYAVAIGGGFRSRRDVQDDLGVKVDDPTNGKIMAHTPGRNISYLPYCAEGNFRVLRFFRFAVVDLSRTPIYTHIFDVMKDGCPQFQLWIEREFPSDFRYFQVGEL